MTYKPGDIVFTMSRSWWVPKAIAWFMQSQWSHAALIVEEGKICTYITEANRFQINFGWLEEYRDDPTASFAVYRATNISDETRLAIVDECLKNTGTVYGYLQLFSLGVRRLLMRVGVLIPNFIRQGMVCDQHVLYGYTKSGLPGFKDIDPESIDTEELYQLVLKSGHFKKVAEG